MEFCNRCSRLRRCCPVCHCCRRCCRCSECCPGPAEGSFQVIKRDLATGAPLAGASYTLYQNGQQIMTGLSGVSGILSFSGLEPGIYELEETAAPDGYRPETAVHQIIVDADGNVTIDGQEADEVSFYNEARNTPDPNFAFRKYDEESNMPLGGATFMLSNGSTAVSDSGGLVDFGSLAPGIYTMTETAAPEGYLANTHSYTVEVSEDGDITIDGLPQYAFSVRNLPARSLSPRPVIYSVTDADTVITGSGVPGAQITVTLPDGTRLTTTADASGNWQAALPAGTTLPAGEIVPV